MKTTQKESGKTILVIEDDKLINALLAKELRRMGHSVEGVHTWVEAKGYLEGHEPTLILLDVNLPDADGLEVLPKLVPHQPVVMLTAYGSIEHAVQAMKAGAEDYLAKPVDLDQLELTVTRAIENAHLREDYRFLKTRLQAQQKPFMVGDSPALQSFMRLIDAVAPTDTTVLIQGESGAGKELVAREIHERSPNAGRNYVVLDCCTLQEHLFESELFGHERGAFTGADKQKKGLVEAAEGGTLFLDEIGEIAPPIQAKLLRIIETGQFRRLGGTKDLVAKVRILAATNRDLEGMAAEGTFRSDLYYRLSAFTIIVPPLRERKEDIPALAEHFIANHDFSRRIKKAVAPNAMEQMMAYNWPGNVRELRNVVERAIILSGESSEIQAEHLGLRLRTEPVGTGFQLSFASPPTMEEVKEAYVANMTRSFVGQRKDLARALGVSERNAYRLINKYSGE